MLAYSAERIDKTIKLKCSDGRGLTTDKWDDIAEFILMPTPKDMAVVWHIDTFVDTIISILPTQVSNKIQSGGRVYSPDNRKLYYQMGRVFGINHINFYGLSRYSEDKIDDVVELARLGERVIEAYRAFGIEASKLSSPVAVYGDVLGSLNFPRACDLPDSAFDMIQACAKVMTREWRDVYKLGHWGAEEITDYDLTAAYPSIVAGLPDISKAKFFKSKAMPDRYSYSWGELYGKLKIVKPVSPLIYQPKNCYPIGEFEDSITTEQLWLLHKYGIGDFEMEYGHFLSLPPYLSFPFKTTMERLYKQRESDNEIVARIAKGISVGIWGKFAEIHEKNKLGEHCNPIYARMTTSRCMVRLATFIYHNQLENDLVTCLVDGCLATKRLPINGNKRMGVWRMNEPKPALVLSLLFQWQGDKKPANMTYSQIMEMIRQKPNSNCYGDVDMNLLDYSRHFPKLPKCGGELLSNKYYSSPYQL